MDGATTDVGTMEARRRGPLTALDKLAAATLIGNAAAFVYVQAFVERALIPPGVLFAVISLVLAGFVLRGSRRAPALGAGWFVMLISISVPLITADLANPADLHKFVWSTLVLLNAVVGIASVVFQLPPRHSGVQESLRPRPQEEGQTGKETRPEP